MSEPLPGENEIERGELLAQIAELELKIRKKLLILVENPNVPPSFKDHPVVKKAVK